MSHISTEEKKITENEVRAYAEAFAEIDFEEMEALLEAGAECLEDMYENEENVPS